MGEKPGEWLEERFNKLLKFRINHLDGRSKLDKCRYCTKLIQCEICHMEFKIDGKVLENKDCNEINETEFQSDSSVNDDSATDDMPEESDRFTAIYITRYLNLGPGLTWSDTKWQGHLVDIDDVDRQYQYPKYAKGSICSAFESAGGHGPSYEEFTMENERRLLAFEEPPTGVCPPYSIPVEEEGYRWEINGDWCWVLTREMPVTGPLENAPDGQRKFAQEATAVPKELATTKEMSSKTEEELKQE
jgi:hypothetical protein